MNKHVLMVLCMVPSMVFAAASRNMERSEYDDVQQVKVNTKIKVGSKTVEKEHSVAPGQSFVIVHKESGLLFDGIVEEHGKEVKINLHLVNHKTNEPKGDKEMTVAWGKPATFSCSGDNKTTAELSIVATQVS